MSKEQVIGENAGPGRTLWKKGQSGNPNGRPPGAKDRRTVAMEEFVNAGSEVALAVVRAAKAGDIAAAALVLARIAPPLKAQAPTVRFSFDATRTLTQQAAQVLEAVAAGLVDPATGRHLVEAISVYAKLRDSDELATRLSHVEAVMSDQLPLVERLGAPRIGIEQLALGDTPDCATTFDGESSNSFQAEPSNSSSDHAAASRQPTVTPRYPPPWAVSQPMSSPP